ncbi:transmembrane protein 169-like [Ptychodera flava]|uniref:transmembrane protein 169-like n=1 Tax=Ptychodera flava TaxID=63121 RepID=UPI003969E139
MPRSTEKSKQGERELSPVEKIIKKEKLKKENKNEDVETETVNESDVHLLERQTSNQLNDSSTSRHDDTIVELSQSRDTINTTTSSVGTKSITLTGTIRRGKKTQDIVQVTISEDNLKALTHEDTPDDCVWGFDKGLHILFFSLLCIPVAFIASFVVSGYLGTITWYGVFVHYYDDKGIAYRILLCPVLIIFYPPAIVLLTLGIALYAAFIQISWFFTSWKRDFTDWEKGFYGWLCSKLHLEEFCAYDVVEVTGEIATGVPATDESTLPTNEAQTSFIETSS